MQWLEITDIVVLKSFILVHIILLLSFREAFPDQSFCVIVGLFYVFYSSTPRAQMRSSFHLLPSESTSITDRQHVWKILQIFYAHVSLFFCTFPSPTLNSLTNTDELCGLGAACICNNIFIFTNRSFAPLYVSINTCQVVIVDCNITKAIDFPCIC